MSNIFRKSRKLLVSEGLSADYIKYAIGEIVLVVVGILIAFSINNWNAERKDEKVEFRILAEISNGLAKDKLDISHNKMGHELGLKACQYFLNSMQGKQSKQDSVYFHYHFLLRDFTSVQNTSGYESLKSKGLEFVKNDSLRTQIITLYAELVPSQRKLEESYEECQFFANYFESVNDIIADHLIFSEAGEIIDIRSLFDLSVEDKARLKSLLWRIKHNREFVVRNYETMESSITELQGMLDKELRR